MAKEKRKPITVLLTDKELVDLHDYMLLTKSIRYSDTFKELLKRGLDNVKTGNKTS